MKHGTAYIQFEDRSVLNRLRLKEHRKSDAFQVKDSAVLWNETDDLAHVLGVWKRGELIASMRLEIIQSKKSLEAKTETEIPEEIKLEYPVGILSKAVTSSEHYGAGLNAHLRYHLIKVAMQKNVQQIFGTLAKGAARSEALLNMGYKFYKQHEDKDLVLLDIAQNGKQAIEACAKLASNSLLFYPWISPAIALKEPKLF